MAELRAPSWSWVCYDYDFARHAIYWPCTPRDVGYKAYISPDDDLPNAIVLDKSDEVDPFGRISSVYVTLKGLLMPMEAWHGTACAARPGRPFSSENPFKDIESPEKLIVALDNGPPSGVGQESDVLQIVETIYL